MTVTPEHIRESNLIENIDDRAADGAGVLAWLWLRDQEQITPDVVRHLHSLATAAQTDLADSDRGEWRRRRVWVGGLGGHEGAPWGDIPDLMDLWCTVGLGYSPPRVAHVDFERIHPFIDGNGRTGRLLMWWHQTQLGEPPTLIRASERNAYYRWFRTGH